MQTLEQLKKQIELYEKNISDQQESLETLREELEKFKQAKTGRLKPKRKEEYFFVTSYGIVSDTHWDKNPVDEDRFVLGNVFRTKEEAEFEVERLKVIAELSDYASEFVDGNDNWFIFWNYYPEEIAYTWNMKKKRPTLYFPSEEIARQAVQAVGEDRVKKYYLGVE